jgi:hypothetical protein
MSPQTCSPRAKWHLPNGLISGPARVELVEMRDRLRDITARCPVHDPARGVGATLRYRVDAAGG